MKHYDSLMIGFGKGAKTLAATLAGRGERVALVERSKQMYGGTCINVGCLPTKSLVDSARYAARAAGSPDEKAAAYAEAIARKNRLTSNLRQKNYDKLNRFANLDIIDGTASFAGPHLVEVAGAKDRFKISADKIFIDTGSTSYIPPIEGAAGSKRVYTSETLLDQDVLPRSLLIIGGGYIGLEFASFYSAFGSRVTVLESGPAFLSREDPEIAAAIYSAMSAKIDFHFAAQVKKIADGPDFAEVFWDEGGSARSGEFDAVLVATGRRPALAALQLERAGIKTERGAIKVDERLRTSVENVWALGDCKGGLFFTYISLDDFRIVESQLTGGPRTSADRGAIPYSVFIEPPFSHIGLTEDAARAQGYDVAVARLEAAAVPKSLVLGQPVGRLKAVVDRSSEKILGASLFCEESHEMINLIKLAMDAGLPYTKLRDQIFTHPTMSEAFNDLFGFLE